MRKIVFFALALLLAVPAAAATYFPSRTDFRDEQIYFLLPTRFYDGDPSNNTQCWDNQSKNAGDPAWRGDFKGLIEKMDYIKALGFTAIWITPIVENASGYDYHGYHAHDFSKVDHRHESEGVSFQTVIDEAHARGMKIILDIVLNHTGNFGEANLCKLFERDWSADQSSLDCMVPFTQKDGGVLPDNYAQLEAGKQYAARLSKMKNSSDENGRKKNYDSHNLWHHFAHGNWDEPNRWFFQIAGDCVDLNTENPAVYNYLIQCYTSFIKMGVDGFRIDTGGHIPRLSFNNAFIPAFLAAGEAAKDKRGGTPFYMFAEVCARYSSILYREHANLSPFYYTWAESKSYDWDNTAASWDNLVEMEGSACTSHVNWKSVWQQAEDDYGGLVTQPTSNNALLSGNEYHTPDYSKASGLSVIDFPVHWNFASAAQAWNIAKPSNDKYYNDATWNVVYVDSHDYAPDEVQFNRFSKPQDTWAENLSLMFTHRGIPCLFYGSEVEFQKGKRIDEGTNIALQNSGRAYFGGYIKGSIQTTDFAEYTNATGNLATSLLHPLAQHIRRLSKIRMAVPALRKGQYSVEGCSGSFAFKRRYTDATTDSYALVCISGNATFSGILNGTYVDCVTGDTKTVTNGKISVSCSGKGNLRVYVRSTALTPAPGKIGEDGKYIYTSSPKNIPDPTWDGTEMELTDEPGNPGGDPSNNTQCWDNQSKNAGDPAWRGDFKGLIEKMDYIKALGFTAIWITPIVENASGYDYHGYHAHDFSKVDHRHESEGVSFQTVIDEAHARGMKIILDIVLNHTGNFGEANLCHLFDRDPNADQSSLDCMVPYTQKDGGLLPDNYAQLEAGKQYAARLSKMKNSSDENGRKKNYDSHNLWHHFAHGNWDEPNRWFFQIAGDCVDLNTENPAVYNYLIRCYTSFIKMGVDGFRIDTGGHIPRLSFNNAFIPAFLAAGEAAKDKRGGTPFYMFAEVCARYSSILYREHANLSPFYYTWAESKSYDWDNNAASWDKLVEMDGSPCTSHTNWQSVWQQAEDDYGTLSGQPTSKNALLEGNTYHTPDYSQASGLNVIDFPVHWNFASAAQAWNIANPSNDKYYNDATWNVVYVDSHDYAPDEVQFTRFSKPQDTWAENLSLMFTHRGIPCIFYGSEVEFQKGKRIDEGTNIALQNSGRAYFGGYIKGTVHTTDFAEYSDATGNLATSLSHPLAQHIRRLSKIRMAVPALRKGQYSVEGCSGSFAFKRRYTDATTDSYALVCISGNATFSGILNGTYIDCVTGDTKTVTDGKLSVTCSGKGNLRVYVLSTDKTPAPGKIGEDGKYIYASSPKNIPDPTWDGTEMELTDDEGGGGSTTEPVDPCLTDESEHAVFFLKSSDFGTSINCYIWHTGTGSTVQVCGNWPGKKATDLGNGNYKFVVPDEAAAIDSDWMIIWNDGSGNQTKDLKYKNQYLYAGANKGAIAPTSLVTAICENSTAIENVSTSGLRVFADHGSIIIIAPQERQGQKLNVYTTAGLLIRTITLIGEINYIDALPAGLYLVGNKKVLL